MKPYKKQAIKISVIIFLMTLFLLVILPAALTGLWAMGGGEWMRRQCAEKSEALVVLDSLCSDSFPKAQGSVDSEQISVRVWRTEKKRVEAIGLEDYVFGVVSSEMPSAFHIEALKAQAVAARTYALAKAEKSADGNPRAHPQAPLCDGTHCQVYQSASELKKIKGKQWVADPENGCSKVKRAVDETKGQVMYYGGNLVLQPLFHSASGERTENSEDVFSTAFPYLRSVESGIYENGAYVAETTEMGLEEFVKKAASLDSRAASEPIFIISRSEGGRVEEMTVGGAILTGRQIRELLGLRSANFTIQVVTDSAGSGGKRVVFTTQGNGHGVGMSQYGADGMGRAGYDYRQILKHYYSGVTVE